MNNRFVTERGGPATIVDGIGTGYGRPDTTQKQALLFIPDGLRNILLLSARYDRLHLIVELFTLRTVKTLYVRHIVCVV